MAVVHTEPVPSVAKQDDRVSVAARISRDAAIGLARIANAQKRSVSAQIALMLEKAIAEESK